MAASRIRKKFPLGLLIFAMALTLYKAAMLTVSMMVDWRAFLILVGLDTLYLGILLSLGIVQSVSRSRWISQLAWFSLLFLTVTYMVDSFVLLALNEHAPLFDMGRYALEPGVVLSFFDSKAYTAIVLLLVSMAFNTVFRTTTRKISYLLLLVATLSAILSFRYSPLPLARYAMLSPAGIVDLFTPADEESLYTAEQIQFYANQLDYSAYIPPSKPNIVLLVVESLSSINSTKVSGTSGYMDGFDRLAEEGQLFPNFFANHQASEGGLIALLGGYPPIHYPTASPYMFDEFAIQPSILSTYRNAGYYTGFITNAELSFIGLNRFLDGIGMDQSRGRDEVAAMRDAPLVVQNAPSDEYLYDEALKTISRLSASSQPFLLTLATTSTHLPYRHPEGGPDTAQAVWSWSLDRLERFYRQLAASGYFETGILMITGDHRQMVPLTAVETRRYGDSAKARVPLLLIGRDYPAGSTDKRFFQQSDLLRQLGKVTDPDAALSPMPLWVERYNRKYGRIELIDSLSVFDETDSGNHEYRLKAPGSQISWEPPKPPLARRVELQIHIQRSQHQYQREEKQRSESG